MKRSLPVALLAFLPSAFLWGGAPVSNLDVPGELVDLRVQEQSRVSVSTAYWQLEFDLRHGGNLDRMIFPHGSGQNVLTRPFRTWVDGWSDRDSADTAFRWTREGTSVRLVFSGRLSDTGGGRSPIEFETSWILSARFAVVDQVLRLKDPLAVSGVGMGPTAIRRDLDEFAARPGIADASNLALSQGRRGSAHAKFGQATDGAKPFIQDWNAPLNLLFFHRWLEGFDWSPSSDLSAWDTQLTGRRGLGRYEARVSADGASIEIRLEPLSAPQPWRVEKGEYRFRYFLGIPRIVEKTNRKWRHLSLGNHPWPSDAEIGRWAECGVNIVRLHNDYSEDGDFWRDGAWPPYGPTGMAEMRRVIATCQRNKIKVVPYFSMSELHPESDGYERHVGEWKRSIDAAGTVLHDLVGKGEYGAQMCLESGWLERRMRDVERAYRELGVDGIYYDIAWTVPCNNPAHAAGPHHSIDSVLALLAWTRRLIGDQGVLVVHSGGPVASIAIENFADLLVTMEHLSKTEKLLRMEDIPITAWLGETAPRAPCPSYRTDLSLERNQRNIAHFVLLGQFPFWRATGPSTAPVGGPGYDLTLKLYRAFQPYKLEEYRFHHARSGVVATNREGVYGALYGSSVPALVVLSNTGPEPQKDVVWRVQPEKLGFVGLRNFSVRDVTSGTSRRVAVAELENGKLVVDLDGYAFRLFEIRPLP